MTQITICKLRNVRANDSTGASPHQRRLHINANGALTNSAATKTFNTNALLQTNHSNDASDANYAFT
jgi:hypothetical protein